MRTVSDKSCRENQNTHFRHITFVKEYGRARQATDNNITRRMRIACWITKATDTHSEYVTLIAFPRQQWLREIASLLRLYLYWLSCLQRKKIVLCCYYCPAVCLSVCLFITKYQLFSRWTEVFNSTFETFTENFNQSGS
jgi:hypothetical protein